MDPASSIITISATSIKLIRETYKYIQEVNVVDDLIKNLLIKLKDLHRLLRVVESTYRRVGLTESSPSSLFVGKTLISCQKRLADVRGLVDELASHDSNTWLEKFALKRKSDNGKKEIEFAMRDIQGYMEHIRTGISCWSLDVASANRRLSEAIAAQQSSPVRTDSQRPIDGEMSPLSRDGEISPLSRSSTDASTLFGPDPFMHQRRSSTTTSRSRPSVSSISSRALRMHSDDNSSVKSSPVSPLVKPNNDWVDFHFQVAKCEGNEARIEEIRSILQRHVAAATLATSTDSLQRTPLHLAAQRGDVELARTLVNFGADINSKDSEPSSILDMAVASNHRKFVEFLLDQGVDETGILSRNEKKFAEIKRIINFSRSTAKSPPKKESRKMSWGIRKGVPASNVT